MKGFFICYIGIDGSGKTTLVNETIQLFKENGKEFKYVWGAHQLCLLRPLVRFGKRFLLGNKDSRKDYGTYLGSIRKVGRSSILSLCYQVALLTEYFVQIYLKIGIPLYLGRNIISDRYMYDTLINLKVNLGMKEKSLFWLMNILLRYLPKPNRLFLIDVPEDIAFARKTDTPSIEYLRVRRRLYKEIGEYFHAVVVDGAIPMETMLSQVEFLIKDI